MCMKDICQASHHCHVSLCSVDISPSLSAFCESSPPTHTLAMRPHAGQSCVRVADLKYSMLAVHCTSSLLPGFVLEGWNMSTRPVHGQSSPKDCDVPTATTGCISPADSGKVCVQSATSKLRLVALYTVITSRV